jgi:SAM-dependent methyltransferase
VTDPPLTIRGWLRYDLVARLLAGLSGVESVLEVGAGEGALGVRLARRYRYVGLELDARSFETARRRFERAGAESIVHGDLSTLPAGASFDLVCAFEVLEHIEDDAAALREWASHLRPDGWLLLSVPAFSRRFGSSDRKAGHYRRYEREQLGATLAAAGLQPRSIQLYGYPLANLVAAVGSALARLSSGKRSYAERTASSGRYFQPPRSLGWLTRAVSAPGRLAQRGFADGERGTGFVVLAQRA